MIKLEDQDFVINPNTGNKVDMKKLLTEQRLAMIYIDTNFPFFSSLLRNLKWIYTFQVPTQATDGTRLLVNPEFTSKLSIKMKAFVMMHEVMHCALDHMARGKNHDPHKSNVAADYEVNGLLESDGVVSKNDLKPYLFDEKYQGMSYEHIYSMNPKSPGEQKMQQGGQQGSGQQGSGQQGGGQGGEQSQEQGPSDKDIDKMSGEQAAQSAQESANRAKEQSANAQHNSSKKDAEKARDAAERAQRVADQAKDAANKGDENTARQKAKEARDAANEAQSAANSGQGDSSGQGGKSGQPGS
jgi:predicted metal-dependent peptidase